MALFGTAMSSLTPWDVLSLKIAALSLASVFWTRWVVGKAPAGIARLTLALPVVALYQYVPFLYVPTEEAISGAFAYGILGWHASFKVLAFCFNRGPLTRQEFTLWQQFALQLLPLYPTNESDTRGRMGDKATALGTCCLRVVFKAVVLRVFLELMKQNRYPALWNAWQALSLFTYVSMVLDLMVLVTRVLFRMHICPTFDQPWRAVSIAEFWSRRWNIATSHLLRQCVYEPVVEGRMLHPEPQPDSTKSKPTSPPLRPTPSARNLGVLASFLVSGIMHELFQYAMNRTALGLMLIFFTVQGPLMMIERKLVEFAKRKKCLPPDWVRNVFTIALLAVLGEFTFLASVNSTGLTVKVVDLQLAGYRGVDRVALQLWDMAAQM